MDQWTSWRDFYKHLQSAGGIFDQYQVTTTEFGAVEGEVYILWMKLLAPIVRDFPLGVAKGQTNVYMDTVGVVLNGAPLGAASKGKIAKADAILDKTFKVSDAVLNPLMNIE